MNEKVFVPDTEILSIRATDLVEYLFCPRFVYYEHCLKIPEHEHTRQKVVKGRSIHRVKQIQNKAYLRKSMGCIKRDFNVYFSSPEHHMRGIMDEVLTLDDGTLAVLDYKFTEYRGKIYRTHKWQLVYYSRLVTLNLNCKVTRGFLVYVRSNNKLIMVPINELHFKKLDAMIENMYRILAENFYPEPTPYRRSCVDCCYRNICPEGFL